MYFKSSIGKGFLTTTIIVTIAISLVIYIPLIDKSSGLSTREYLGHGLAILVFLCFFGTWAMSPKAIKLTDRELVLLQHIGKITIPLSEITYVSERDKNSNHSGDMRLFGSGGYFGNIGRFRNTLVGNYYSCVNNTDEMFYVFTDKKKYLFSCDKSKELVYVLKEKINA